MCSRIFAGCPTKSNRTIDNVPERQHPDAKTALDRLRNVYESQLNNKKSVFSRDNPSAYFRLLNCAQRQLNILFPVSFRVF